MSSYNTQIQTKSLYIHWPFCPYRCHYCPFVAMAGQDNFMEQYHNALTNEINAYAQKLSNTPQIDTIYFGGGTPSTYPSELLLDTFGILKNTFIIGQNTELTLEVNPGTVDDGQVKFWRELGINRMSVGVQSLNDAVLQKLNRHQKASDVVELLDHAFEYIENISVDVILGLPGVSADEFKKTLQKLTSWPIKHISMYMLVWVHVLLMDKSDCKMKKIY